MEPLSFWGKFDSKTRVLIKRYGFIVLGNGFTDLLAVLEADVEKPFTSLLFISDIWYGQQTILTYSSVIFTLGALLIALHMSAVYSLLLFLALIAFTLQIVQYYIGFSTIPSKFEKTSISFLKKYYSVVGVVWLMVTVCSVYIFFAEIVNTIAERHLIPLGNALVNYKELKFVNPFS